MILAIALATALHVGDSSVAQIPTGELIHSRSYGTWEEVLQGRERANMAGFGSVSFAQEPSGYVVHFRVYGDSSAQHQQWKRLEALLDDSLFLQRVPSWIAMHPRETNPEPEDTGRLAFNDVIKVDSATTHRQISISDSYKIIARQDSAEALQQSLAMNAMPDTESPLRESDSTLTLKTDEAPDLPKVGIPMEPREAAEQAIQNAENEEDLPPSEVKNTPPPQSQTAPKALVTPNTSQNAANHRADQTMNPPGAQPSKMASPAAQKSPPQEAAPPTPRKMTTPAAPKVTGEHPFPPGMHYALVFGSFSDLSNAQAYLSRVKERFPQAQLWTRGDMYRIASPYPYYPGAGLKEAKAYFPKTWVSPL